MAMAVVSYQCGLRIPDLCSIFTAEARTMLLALEYVELFDEQCFFICTDSTSCLQALDFLDTDHPLIEQIQEKVELFWKILILTFFVWSLAM